MLLLEPDTCGINEEEGLPPIKPMATRCGLDWQKSRPLKGFNLPRLPQKSSNGSDMNRQQSERGQRLERMSLSTSNSADRLAGNLKPIRRVVIGLAFTLLVVLVATLSYHQLGWSWSDSFYMVIITIFGVGYGEVHPVDTGWLRGVTISIIVFGYAGAVYTVGAFVQFLIDGELQKLLGERRMQREIDQLNHHIIVCGYGRMGTLLADTLRHQKRSLLMIDSNPHRIREARAAGLLAIEGNATEEEVLRMAGIERASILASVLSDDASNIFLTITAHELNPGLAIYSRAEQFSTIKKLLHVGASKVISPSHIGADRLAHLILHPSAESLLQQTQLPEGLNDSLGELGLEIDELEIPSHSALCGETLEKALSHLGHGLLSVALRSADGKVHVSPLLTETFHPNDVWIVLGRREDIAIVREKVQREIGTTGTKNCP